MTSLYSGNESLECPDDRTACPSSGVCISKNSSDFLKEQCMGNQTARPYEVVNTTCPNVFECKREFGLYNDPGLPICLEEKALCDGIPQCPYWDDEARCPIDCPSECTICSPTTYKCQARFLSRIPQNAKSIDLSGQNLNITELCAIQRISLSSLNLSNCGLTDISCVYNGRHFPALIHLDVSHNNVKNSFIGGRHLKMNLDGNPVSNIIITSGWVDKLTIRNSNITKIQWMYIKPKKKAYLCINCNVTDVEDDNCPECKFRLCVEDFNLSRNFISNVRFINYCQVLQKVDVSYNRVSTFGKRSYKSNFLKELFMHHNILTYISPSVFNRMTALKVIDLSWNLIDTIQEGTFQTLERLKILNLSFNRLREVHTTVFNNLLLLQDLSLQGNELMDLPSLLFKDLIELKTLDLSKNNLQFLRNDLFEGLLSLEYLDLKDNDIETYETMFDRLGVLQFLYVHDFSLCCAKPKSVSSANCEAPLTIVSSCTNLVGSGILGVYIWLLVLLTFFGNISLIYSYLQTKEIKKHFLSMNYCLAEISLSLYLIIVAYKDVESRGRYGFEDRDWRQSSWCQIADTLYSVSLEATTLLIFIILVEQRKYRKFQFVVDCILSIFTWFFSIAVSLAPKMYESQNSKLGICVNLPVSKFLRDSDYSEYLVILHLLFNAFISVCVIILKLYQSLWERRKVWLTRCGTVYNRCLNNLVLVLITRNFIIFLTGYLVINDIDLVDYDWIVLFLIPSCSVLSVIKRRGFRHGKDRKVLITRVFDVRNSLKEPGGTMIIFINIDKGEKCMTSKGFGVLVTNEETMRVHKPSRIRIVRNIILADFTKGLDKDGEVKAWTVSIFTEGKQSISYRHTDV